MKEPTVGRAIMGTAGLLFLFLLLAFGVTGREDLGWEAGINDGIQRHDDRLALAGTYLADAGFILAAICGVYGYVRYRDHRLQLIVAASLCTLAYVLARVAKWAIARPRPDTALGLE